jgi:hypothetical protein
MRTQAEIERAYVVQTKPTASNDELVEKYADYLRIREAILTKHRTDLFSKLSGPTESRTGRTYAHRR